MSEDERQAIEAGLVEYEDQRGEDMTWVSLDDDTPVMWCAHCGSTYDGVPSAALSHPYCERCRWGRHPACAWGSAEHQACHASRLGALAIGGASYIVGLEHGDVLAYRHAASGIVVAQFAALPSPEEAAVALDDLEHRGRHLAKAVERYFWADEFVTEAVLMDAPFTSLGARLRVESMAIPWAMLADIYCATTDEGRLATMFHAVLRTGALATIRVPFGVASRIPETAPAATDHVR